MRGKEKVKSKNEKVKNVLVQHSMNDAQVTRGKGQGIKRCWTLGTELGMRGYGVRYGGGLGVSEGLGNE